MKRKPLTVLTALSLFFFDFGICMLMPPSFSGDWKINVDQSENAQAAPKEVKINLSKDSIFIERVTSDDQSFLEKLSFDGKLNTCTTTSGRKKSGSAKWDEEGKSFTENATLSEINDQGKTVFNVVEHWELSGDQKQLTITTTLSNASGASAQRQDVYDRQD
jgi:hypothetical protein